MVLEFRYFLGPLCRLVLKVPFYGVTEGLYHRGSLSGLWFKLSFVLCAFRFLRQQKLIYL